MRWRKPKIPKIPVNPLTIGAILVGLLLASILVLVVAPAAYQAVPWKMVGKTIFWIILGIAVAAALLWAIAKAAGSNDPRIKKYGWKVLKWALIAVAVWFGINFLIGLLVGLASVFNPPGSERTGSYSSTGHRCPSDFIYMVRREMGPIVERPGGCHFVIERTAPVAYELFGTTTDGEDVHLQFPVVPPGKPLPQRGWTPKVYSFRLRIMEGETTDSVPAMVGLYRR
jgi:hypothetical protein